MGKSDEEIRVDETELEIFDYEGSDADDDNVPLIPLDERSMYTLEENVSEYLKDLDDAILKLQSGGAQLGQETAFLDALNNLRKDLAADIGHQIRKKKKETQISASSALVIARETTVLVSKLISEPNYQHQNVIVRHLDYFRVYEEKCKTTSGFRKFLNGVGTVIAMGVGAVVGAGIGAGIGYAVGAWAGPGGIVTAVLGLIKGASTGAALGAAVTGAGLGLAASCAGGGMVGGYIGWSLYNRPNKLTRDVNKVMKAGHTFFARKETERLGIVKDVDRGERRRAALLSKREEIAKRRNR